ncbi:hypothetical protein Syun_028234 [Stephania yunnanensis]|uniref:DUF7148 domain-containing protein n=1 Tax=Stephania yunnanensis TaxID=152371 RepID=A0AAP0EPA9_9MAGN
MEIKTKIPVYIDCLVFPASADDKASRPFSKAVSNGPKRDEVPPGEPIIMRRRLLCGKAQLYPNKWHLTMGNSTKIHKTTRASISFVLVVPRLIQCLKKVLNEAISKKKIDLVLMNIDVRKCGITSEGMTDHLKPFNIIIGNMACIVTPPYPEIRTPAQIRVDVGDRSGRD